VPDPARCVFTFALGGGQLAAGELDSMLGIERAQRLAVAEQADPRQRREHQEDRQNDSRGAPHGLHSSRAPALVQRCPRLFRPTPYPVDRRNAASVLSRSDAMATHRDQRSVSLMTAVLTAALVTPGTRARCDEDLTRDAALALSRAVTFFRHRVSAEGGYLWRYSEDLRFREGEGAADASVVWVQPPGTPAVGSACLGAYRASGERLHLDAARDAARVLVRGQLRSGGWTYRIELDPERRKRIAYLVDPPQKKQRNVSTLDDDTTQSALRFLIEVDEALEAAGASDAEIHAAVRYGLDMLLAAQHPSGGFPQGFEGPADASRAARKASYPEEWPRSPPRDHDYWHFATLNDDLVPDLLATLFDAERAYREPRFREAAKRLGDFLILAQMPEPQPGWAQQYDFEMRPVWARKFEPPSISGGEGQGAMRALIRLARETGDKKYLEPVPRALAYYRRSLLPDGRLARFYELRTNRPLYFTRQYELTYRDDDLPTHYSFVVASKLDEIEHEYERVKNGPPEKDVARAPSVASLAKAARRAIDSLDDKGRWVEDGTLRSEKSVKRVIDCRTFIRNVEALSRYLEAARAGGSGGR
jgi:PelA/Pel-15E family pectate lyase